MVAQLGLVECMGSQKEIAAQIVKGGGDYVLAIEDNHPTLAEAMAEHFDKIHEEGLVENNVRQHQTIGEMHGRSEKRITCHAAISESVKELTATRSKAKSIGQVHNITVRDGKETAEVRYFFGQPACGCETFRRSRT